MLGDRIPLHAGMKGFGGRVGSEADDKDDDGESGVGSNVNLFGYIYACTYMYII